MADWLLWALLLVLQNAGHTATSRARNTTSLWYTGIASVFSNGIWFASQFFIVTKLMEAQGDWPKLLVTLFFYVTFTVFGSVTSHWYLMRFEQKRHIVKG